MKRYLVYPSVRIGWEMRREGDPVSLFFPDREAAIGYARCLADANRPSALTIETPHRQVEAAWMFETDGAVRLISASRC